MRKNESEATHKKNQTMKTTFAAVILLAGLSAAPLSAGDQGHSVHVVQCSGGPKTHDWTAWQTVGRAGGIEMQASYYMESHLFGLRRKNQIRYRFVSHRSSMVDATVADVVVQTDAGEVFTFPGQSVTVHPGQIAGGPIYAIKSKGKLCTVSHKFFVH